MEAKPTSDGARRVMAVLFEPLELLGMKRWTGCKAADWDRAKVEVCARLAHLTKQDLTTLADTVRKNAVGKSRDTFPAGIAIIRWGVDLSPKSGDTLIQRVFRHGIGRDAVEGGYAVELREIVIRLSRFPSEFVINQARVAADDNRRKMRDIEAGDVSQAALAWLERYRLTAAECARMAAVDGGEVGA